VVGPDLDEVAEGRGGRRCLVQRREARDDAPTGPQPGEGRFEGGQGSVTHEDPVGGRQALEHLGGAAGDDVDAGPRAAALAATWAASSGESSTAITVSPGRTSADSMPTVPPAPTSQSTPARGSCSLPSTTARTSAFVTTGRWAKAPSGSPQARLASGLRSAALLAAQPMRAARRVRQGSAPSGVEAAGGEVGE